MIINVAKNKNIEIKVKNGRDLLLLHNMDSVRITKEKNEIVKLDFYGNTYGIGDTISINNDNIKSSYTIRYIKQTSNYSFELSSEILTKSSVFLFPLVSQKDSIHKNYFFNTYFYNAYINLTGQDEFNDSNHLFLVYRFFNTEYFKDLEKLIMSSPNFIKTVEPDVNFTAFVMAIPIQFKQDAKRILRGQYSKISTTAKSKIITFHTAHIDSELYHILHRSDVLKSKLETHLGCSIPEDIELCSKPEFNKETYGF